LKKALVDPDSLQFVSTTQPVITDYEGRKCWGITFRYRSKNGFGGYVVNDAVAYIFKDTVIGLKSTGVSP
jgi:hypothetical protein